MEGAFDKKRIDISRGHFRLVKVEMLLNQMHLTCNSFPHGTHCEIHFSPWNKQPFLLRKLSKVKTEYVWLYKMLQFYRGCEQICLGYSVQFSIKN